MANHWAIYGITTRESEQKLRLDPCHLPQSICYKGRKSGEYFTAFLTERGILIQEHACAQNLALIQNKAAAPAFSPQNPPYAHKATGAVLKIFSPRQFRGIAACKIAVNQGQTEPQKAFCLMLLHEEADYCVPLLVSAHKDDVVLDWRLWADSYNLPMLIMEEGRGFRPLGGRATLKLFINDHKIDKAERDFSLRCRGLSLNTRLVLANQVMLG